jgi:hypothetical protein
MPDNTQAGSLPPHVQLVQMGRAFMVSRIVYAAAKLGLADQLASESKNAAELAGSMHVDAPSLHRLMRALASLGILTERSEQCYALTALGEALKTGAPGSARASVLMQGSPWFQNSFDHVADAIQTGKNGFEKVHNQQLFDYLAQHPEDGSLYNEAMAGLTSQEPAAVVAAYDFSPFNTIIDVGGGTGNMIAAVLTRHPGLRGVLFDRPHVVADAAPLLEAKALSSRIRIEAGDFLQTVPHGGEAYVLSHIIHNFSEDQCLTILGHVHEAMKLTGRLLIIETVLLPGDVPDLGKMLDMTMLAVGRGQERTEIEYSHLLSRAGFRLIRVVPTKSRVSVVEAGRV